jgi:membrane-associated protease RseP (regulator of RpoE activity)
MPKLNIWQWLSIVINFCVYLLFGWKFAVVMIVGLVCHELGHLIVAKKMGTKTNGFYIVLLVGAVSDIVPCRTLWKQARMLLAGPIVGNIPAIIAIVLYWATGIQWLACAAFWISAFNALNLLPMSPILDGGRIFDAITYSINKKMGLCLAAIMSLVGLAISLVCGFPITGIVMTALGFLILFGEYEKQRQESRYAHELNCEYDDVSINRPLPMTHKQMWMTALIWLVAMLVLTAVCVYVWHIGLVSLRLLLRHGLTKR